MWIHLGPSLTLKLSNSRSSLLLMKDAEQWALFFDGEIEKKDWRNTFHILVREQEVLNGYKLQADVYIDPSLHEGKNARERDKELGIGKPGHIAFSYLDPKQSGTGQHEGGFEVYVRLSPDEIHRLRQVDLSTHQIFLQVGFPFSMSPDGKRTGAIYVDGEAPWQELVWNTDTAFYSPIEQMQFVIMPVQQPREKETELSAQERLPNEAQAKPQGRSDRIGKDSSPLSSVVEGASQLQRLRSLLRMFGL